MMNVFKTILKTINLLRDFWLHIAITLTCVCVSYLFANKDRLYFKLHEDIGIVNFLTNKTTLLIVIFLTTTLAMPALHYFRYKTLNARSALEYTKWFLTALATSAFYTLYSLTFQVYNSLLVNKPIDLIYKNSLFEIRRGWLPEEIAHAIVEVSNKFKVSLADSQVNAMAQEYSHSIEAAIKAAAQFCQEKLRESEAIVAHTNNKGWFSDVCDFAANNKAWLIVGTVVSGLVLAAVAKYCMVNYSTFTTSTPTTSGIPMDDGITPQLHRILVNLVQKLDSTAKTAVMTANKVEYAEASLRALLDLNDIHPMARFALQQYYDIYYLRTHTKVPDYNYSLIEAVKRYNNGEDVAPPWEWSHLEWSHPRS